MKKILLICLVATTVLYTACTKESYTHTMSVLYPNQVAVVGADQQYDTLLFYTSDNFRITSTASWISVPDTIREGKIPNYYRQVFIVPAMMVFEPNTTGEVRTGSVAVNSYGDDDDDWNQTVYASYTQLAWLDITRPTPNYAYLERTITAASFELKDSAAQVVDTLCFHVYGDWTLSDGTFVHPSMMNGEAGQFVVPLTVEPNGDAMERKDTLTLMSRGVSTKIAIKQQGK